MPLSPYVSACLRRQKEVLSTVGLALKVREATNPSVRGWFFETRVLRSVESGHELLFSSGKLGLFLGFFRRRPLIPIPFL
jgi:hypothetical protein